MASAHVSDGDTDLVLVAGAGGAHGDALGGRERCVLIEPLDARRGGGHDAEHKHRLPRVGVDPDLWLAFDRGRLLLRTTRHADSNVRRKNKGSWPIG